MNKPIIELLFDSHHGIYIPQMFARQCNPLNSYWVWGYDSKPDGQTETDGEILSNPDHELYFEVWEDVIDSAYYFDPSTGEKYFLESIEGDLWAIKEGYSVNEFGELFDPKGLKVEV